MTPSASPRSSQWGDDALAHLSEALELQIAPVDPDGRVGRFVPIWVVVADDDVYVRTWQRRETGWYGAVLRNRRAQIRVHGLDAEALVEPADGVGVDDAYRAKYGAGAASMITSEAAASTLRLRPGD